MEFYHVLNRGVDKRKIFLGDKDYFRFVHNLFEFNDVSNVSLSNSHHAKKLLDIGCPNIGNRGPTIQKRRARKLLVKIHFFCLMPNHYHLLLSPLVENGISLFMKKLNMGYAKYFNEKHKRDGALFQGKYKKVLIERDAHFLWIPYYIHFNPLDLVAPEWRDGRRTIDNPKKALEFLNAYRWSSHGDYMGKKNFPSVTQREFFLESFGGENAYKKSIIQHFNNIDVATLSDIALE